MSIRRTPAIVIRGHPVDAILLAAVTLWALNYAVVKFRIREFEPLALPVRFGAAGLVDLDRRELDVRARSGGEALRAGPSWRLPCPSTQLIPAVGWLYVRSVVVIEPGPRRRSRRLAPSGHPG